MIFFRICIFLLSFWVIQSFGQGPDSLLLVKKSQFLLDLSHRPGSFTLNDAPPNSIALVHSPKMRERGQQVLKSNNQLYIHFAGGGLLYQMQEPKETDSLLVFKRLDRTENDGYNFAAFLFANGDDIYNIGGYGFWKSNGTLRKFNKDDQEWDVAPVNEEIYLPGISSINWYDQQAAKLYVPYQQKVNAGLIDKEQKSQLIKNVHVLDLKNFQWNLLGKTNNKALELLQNSNTHTPTNQGLLVATEDDVYLIDFKSNQISKIHNSSYAQSLSRLGNQYLRYYYQGKLYLYNTTNHHYDSLLVDQKAFVPTGIPIWEKNFTWIWLILGLVMALIAGVLVYGYFRKKKKPLYLHDQAGSQIKINFTETERSLIKLLLEKYKEGSTATIHEINYVLGTKDKNMGMQKKVRSDVINSINEKYSYLSQEQTALIQSFRSETDKRYFEYLIKKEQVSKIEKWLIND
ncbi:MAG: hypothetical protein CFE25_07375 [Chitinophagaceae bacterium BSSC1]|nr:MAG: hypothetical protein CFE25_07375 [Chitinophagaceae bacterium BSSC1]